MASRSDEFNSGRPWARTGFDIEGWIGALAALLFGIFAGAFWYPLFLVGFLAAVIVLAGTRWVERSMPAGEFRVIAPCDGVVSAVELASPPSEFELGGEELMRIRISSSPLSPNTLFAPVTGAVTASAFDEGEPSRLLATQPDLGGLEVAYLAIGSGREAVGLKVMSAGFGPRLDVETETGDLLRAGRAFAKRRLGGWCDVYLPAGLEAAVWPGQTIIGGETELAALSDTWVVREDPAVEPQEEPVKAGAAEMPEIDLEDLGTSHATSATSHEVDNATEDETAKLFEKLRREAQGIENGD